MLVLLLWKTLGGITAPNSSSAEPLLSPTTSSPSRNSETSTVDTGASIGLLRPYQKSDSTIPLASAFSARTTITPDQLQPPGVPVTAFSPLLTPAMMAAQIGLLSTPNTLLSMMQAATAQNSLIHHERCNERNGQIVPTMLHQLSALHSNQVMHFRLSLMKAKRPYSLISSDGNMNDICGKYDLTPNKEKSFEIVSKWLKASQSMMLTNGRG
ncbi:unnamed protein product [Litomosoides sigmodontis]|uniref:Uncharacterized protein n=1 Tax=Litomosoides sigmodontis TaxID=42156 RepID=A0A3P6UDX8_LITSI|nr:unnamed protein product [Litomosoides sigmodontis]